MKIKLPEIKLYKRHPENKNFGYTDTYGVLKILEEYCGRPLPLTRPIDWFYWTHGCHGPWRMVHPALLTGNLQDKKLKYLVESKEQEAYLKNNGFKNVHAVGLPIIYVKDIEVQRIPKSLLIMPSHTLQGNSKLDQAAYDSYITFLEPYLKHFEVIKVCLHQGCLDNNMWVKEFADLGIDIIEGANPEDENALLRQKCLFKQFEHVTTNSWGSHVAYALYFGCKVSICGPYKPRPREDYLIDGTWKKNLDVLDLLLSEKVEIKKAKILSCLSTQVHQGILDIEFGRKLVGFQNKKPPNEILKIIKPNYQELISHYLIRIKR